MDEDGFDKMCRNLVIGFIAFALFLGLANLATAFTIVDIFDFMCPYECGDTNGDGVVEWYDALKIVQEYSGIPNDPFHFGCADLDTNGIINRTDYLILMDHLNYGTPLSCRKLSDIVCNSSCSCCDDDGLDTAQEGIWGTDPCLGDTDGDGMLDGIEVYLGTDPLNPDVYTVSCVNNITNVTNVTNVTHITNLTYVMNVTNVTNIKVINVTNITNTSHIYWNNHTYEKNNTITNTRYVSSGSSGGGGGKAASMIYSPYTTYVEPPREVNRTVVAWKTKYENVTGCEPVVNCEPCEPCVECTETRQNCPELNFGEIKYNYSLMPVLLLLGLILGYLAGNWLPLKKKDKPPKRKPAEKEDVFEELVKKKKK